MESEIVKAMEKTCRACMVANLTDDVKIARCVKCELIYCVHFASKLDPRYCVECLAEIALHKETIVKTYTHERYDADTDTLITSPPYKRRARLVKLEGLDWLFAQRSISGMSDDELELAIEYHREIQTGMIAEREDRKAKFLHRYANTKFDSVTTDGSKVTTVAVKKVRTISSTKAQAVAASTLEAMVQGGTDLASILAMLQGVQAAQKVKP